MPAASDFPAPARAPVAWEPAAVLGATFALGFVEGCMEVARRPIPLRFALRFAAANVLPSAVWGSVPARHVAAVARVAPAALIIDAELAGPQAASVGRRLVLIRSVRALRLAAGSYGLAWSLWRLRNDRELNDKEEETERVVRLAPVHSLLSRASARTHGEHIVSVSMTTEKWRETVDWEKVGLQVQGEQKVKMIEVELSDAEEVEVLAELKAQVKGTVCSVAVLPMNGSPLPTAEVEKFDVVFNPLSAVLTFIASVCYDRGIAHVVLVGDEDVEGEVDNASSTHISTSQLAAGLLCRHGITSTVLKTVDEEAEGGLEADHQPNSDSNVFLFVSESLSEARAAVSRLTEQGFIEQQNAFFVVEESLCGQTGLSGELQAQSALLEVADKTVIEKQEKEVSPVYLSVADVSDQTLQGIRELVRHGKKPEAIQGAVYQAYGTQRVVAPTRVDKFSNLHV